MRYINLLSLLLVAIHSVAALALPAAGPLDPVTTTVSVTVTTTKLLYNRQAPVGYPPVLNVTSGDDCTSLDGDWFPMEETEACFPYKGVCWGPVVETGTGTISYAKRDKATKTTLGKSTTETPLGKVTPKPTPNPASNFTWYTSKTFNGDGAILIFQEGYCYTPDRVIVYPEECAKCCRQGDVWHENSEVHGGSCYPKDLVDEAQLPGFKTPSPTTTCTEGTACWSTWEPRMPITEKA